MPDSVVGQIALELGLESANFKKQLMNICNREGSSAAQSLTNTFTKAFSQIGTVMAAAFSAGKIIEFGKKCIGSAASVNAANSQLEQTFGSLQEKAETAMKTVAKESGIVETRLQGVGTSIYAFAKTSGMDSATALSMMQEALQVTADSAAYYDRSLEDTAESLKSFLKGNYANDAALGISCTETTRNAAANKLYGKSFQQLSEAQKQLTLLQMVKDANKLSGALGQAARESDGWENVTGNLTESFKQLFAVIGQPILAIATKGVKALTAAIQKLTVYAKTAVKAISDMFGLQMSDSVDSMAAMSDTADSASEAIDDTTDAVKKLKKATAGFDQLNILSSDKSDNTNSDNTTTDTSSAALSVPIDTSAAENSVGEFENIFDKLKNKFDKLLKTTGLNQFFSNFKKQIQEINFSSIYENFKSIFDSMQPIAEARMNGMRKVFSSFSGFIGTVFGGAARTFANHLQTITGGMARWLSKDHEKISGFITNISDNLSSGFDNLSDFAKKVSDIWNQSIEKMRPDTEKAISDLLSGFTDFGGALGTIFSEGFNSASKIISDWADDNSESLGEFFDNIQKISNDVMKFIGTVFSDIGNGMVSWWKSDGQKMWKNICKAVTNAGSLFLRVFNEWVRPTWDNLIRYLMSAWQGFKDVFKKLKSTFELLPEIVIGSFNIIIDAINGIWSAIYSFVGGFVDSIGGISGAISSVFGQDWSFSMPAKPTLIPHLAAGGLVKAPTLALVGDNKGASHDPEVVSPLSKLQDMMNSGNPEIIRLLLRIIALLENEETTFQNNFYVDSEKIESRLIKVRRRKQRRYGGAAV